MKKPAYVIQTFMVGVCIFLTTSSVFAQELMDEDPLLKPEIWALLKESPNNDQLWEKYFDKDLFSLTKDEYAQLDEWRKGLNELIKKRDEQAELKRLKLFEDYQKQRHGMRPETLYQELVQNVLQNFDIIEEYFKKEYEKYGQGYNSYILMHPDGSFSKTLWVEEQEKKLEEFKITQR